MLKLPKFGILRKYDVLCVSLFLFTVTFISNWLAWLLYLGMLRKLMTSGESQSLPQQNPFNDIIFSKSPVDHKKVKIQSQPTTRMTSEEISSNSELDSNYSDEMNIPLCVSKCLNCSSTFIPQYSPHSDEHFCSRDCFSCYGMFHKLPEKKGQYAEDRR
jgi:hypothetical protein